MSYTYRKINYDCAEWLLEVLNREITIEQDSLTGKFKRTVYKRRTFEQLNDISQSAYIGFTIEDIERAARLLLRNHHVAYIYNHDDFMNSTLVCTVEGEDAYNESFYTELIRKDFEEQMGLKIRWLLPYLTITLSIAALIISLMAYLHPHK